MTYIIFDLEFNQTDDLSAVDPKIAKCPFEIIQIGAYKLDDQLNAISTFNAFVKPKLFRQIHPFIQELTKISQEQLDHANPFDQVLFDFSTFIGDMNSIFCVWGMGDIRELYRNILYHNIQEHFIINNYINIQRYASKHFHLSNGKNISLRNAVDLLNIPLNKPLHDALNDAYYTAEIFKILKMNTISPKTYLFNSSNTQTVQRKPKKKIDLHGLIQQFEKMYERELTEDEKSMIVLSYKMGITHQFQIIDS